MAATEGTAGERKHMCPGAAYCNVCAGSDQIPAEPDAGDVEALAKVIDGQIDGIVVRVADHHPACDGRCEQCPVEAQEWGDTATLARAVLASDWLAAVRREAGAKALTEAADALPAATEGTDRIANETWLPNDRDIYSLAIEEAQSALRDRAARMGGDS